MPASEPTNPSFDGLSDYERRHVIQHLLAAGRDEEAHVLLALDTAEGGNAWFEYLRDRDEMEGFVSSVDLCKQAALAQGEDGISLAMRYALVGASISSQAATVAAELLDAMVKARVISLGHALTLARQNSDSAQGAVALALLSRHAAARGSVEIEAVAALGAVPFGEAVEAYNILLGILPLSTPIAPIVFNPVLSAGSGPPLHKLFARRFLSLKAGELASVAAIFSHPDEPAAAELLALIGMPRQEGVVTKGRGPAPSPQEMRSSEAAWELGQMYDMEDNSGSEEVAAALIGLAESKVALVPDLERLALQAILRIRSRDNRLIFIARMLGCVSDRLPAIEAARALLEQDAEPTYAAALAATVVGDLLEGNERGRFSVTAVTIAVKFRLAQADRWRLKRLAEQMHHRTVLLARALALDPLFTPLISQLCVAYCDVDELEEREKGRDQDFPAWLCEKIRHHLERSTGAESKEPGEWRSVAKLESLETDRNLAEVTSCLPHAQQCAILKPRYQELTSYLDDRKALTALRAAIATCLPRDCGLEILRKARKDSRKTAVFTHAIATIAPDSGGVELLDATDPEAIRPELLQRLSLEDLLHLKRRVEAQPEGTDRDRVLTEIIVTMFVCHHENLLAEELARLAGAEMYSWTTDRIVRVMEAAPSGYGPELKNMIGGLRTPRGWGARSVAAQHARLFGALACRDDLPEGEDLLRRALSEAAKSHDHVCIALLGKLAPKLPFAVRRDIDRAVASTKGFDDRLEALTALLTGRERIARRYARKALRTIVVRGLRRRATDSRAFRRAIERLAPRLGPRMLRLVLWAYPGTNDESLPLYRRLAEIGGWREVLERSKVKSPGSWRVLLEVLPYVPVEERERIVAEIVEMIDEADESHAPSLFRCCDALRPYLEGEAWRAFALRRMRDLLVRRRHPSGLVPPEKPTGPELQWLADVKGRGSVLGSLPLSSLSALVTAHRVESPSRLDFTLGVAIMIPALSRSGRLRDLMNVDRAIEDVARWWPSRESGPAWMA
jgi:hypothetical protein